jgi:flagellar hook-length control protein FliK
MSAVKDICVILEKSQEYDVPLKIQGSLMELKSGLDDILDENFQIPNCTIAKVNEALEAILENANIRVRDDFSAALNPNAPSQMLLNRQTQSAEVAQDINAAIAALGDDDLELEISQDNLMIDIDDIDLDESLDLARLRSLSGENILKGKVEQKILDDLKLNIDNITISQDADDEAGTETVAQAVARINASANNQIIMMSINPEMEIKADMNIQELRALNNQTAAQNAATHTSAAAVPLNKTDLLDQIGVKFNKLLEAKDNQGNAKITMTLRPVELGRVTIELTQTGKGIVTTIVAQDNRVKELLERNIEALRAQLGSVGVNVQNIHIKAADASSKEFEDDFEEESEGERPREEDGESPKDKKDEQSKNQNRR